jgi:hypothetical protein
MRTKGSCRFEAYFKLEKWDDRLLVWKPIQKAFPTIQLAKDARPKGKTRIMECSETGIKEVIE